jgi:hypothetical protein
MTYALVNLARPISGAVRFPGARVDGRLNSRGHILALAHDGLNRRKRVLYPVVQLIGEEMHPLSVALLLANVPDFRSRPDDVQGVITDRACHVPYTQAPLAPCLHRVFRS